MHSLALLNSLDSFKAAFKAYCIFDIFDGELQVLPLESVVASSKGFNNIINRAILVSSMMHIVIIKDNFRRLEEYIIQRFDVFEVLIKLSYSPKSPIF